MILVGVARHRVGVGLGCAALVGILFGASVGAVHATPLFGLADASTGVFRGVVERVTPYPKGKLQVFTIGTEQVLKGDLPVDAPVELVQEMLFESTRPYFERGTRTLVFVVPLPNYSGFRQVLPERSYLRWTERLDTAGDVAVFSDPALIEPLTRYLAVRDDPEATARYLATLLGGEHPRLRVDALSAIAARPELAPLLDAAALAPVRTVLADDRLPLTERAQILVVLARVGAAGIAPIAEELSVASGPLQPAAVDALVTIGRMPSEQRLVAYSQSTDAALRLAAVRGLAKSASPGAFERLQQVVTTDPSDDVRVAALEALGTSASPGAVPLLESVLREGDKRRVAAAAEALGRLASPDAIAALARTLEKGTIDAQTAAAFALGRARTEKSVAILREQEESHPDPQVRRLCKLALGESMHEH